MKKVSRFSILIICILLISQIAHAQQYRWVRGGGTAESTSSFSYDEESFFVCTDPNGNVYSLNVVANYPIYVDTFFRSGGFGNPNNLLVSSYNCAGQLRWAKLIASSGGECDPFGIITDNIGHVYIAGHLATGVLHIGNDTALTYINQGQGLIQLDTVGNFNWIRFIGDNSLATHNGAYTYGSTIFVDGSNNIHYLSLMKYGVPITSSLTSHRGSYDIRYNPTGVLISAKKLNFDSTLNIMGATLDKRNNKLYTYGNRDDSYIDSTYHCFLASFDTSRNLIWLDTLANPGFEGNEYFSGVVADSFGHIYATASGHQLLAYMGDTARNALTSSSEVSFVMKADTSGHPLWMRVYSCNTAINDFSGITLMQNNKLAVVGGMTGKITSGGDTLNSYSGEGQNAYFSVLDTAGHVLDLQQIHGDGFYDWGNAITSDQYGNLYIGGKVANTTWGGTIPAYHTHGGNSDFYVMKYGYECGCTSATTSSFTSTGTITVNVTYTGTTTSLDSVVWTYGDGYTNTGISAAHTYTASGTYTVCAIAYSGCGIDTSCHSVVINIPSAINAVPGFENVLVYPNPTGSEINITGLNAMTKYQLQDITGQVIGKGLLSSGSNNVSLDKMPNGIYMLALETVDGSRTVLRVVKDR